MTDLPWMHKLPNTELATDGSRLTDRDSLSPVVWHEDANHGCSDHYRLIRTSTAFCTNEGNTSAIWY